jgi:DNA-binding NarL/FixJ family response regulator
VTFPPVVLFFDGVDHWLADGFHRYHAAKAADWRDLGAEVHEGTQRDAVLFSVGANAAHGSRRTNADKRKAATTLLSDDEWKQWSDKTIATKCGVSHDLVRDIRLSLTPSVSEPRAYTTKHGTVATMNTENIGKRDRTRKGVEERNQQIREMAAGGYTRAQIADSVGLDEDTVSVRAKSLGVELIANKAMGKPVRHDSNRILEHIVMDAENLTADVGLIDFSSIDRARLSGWIDSLISSRRSLDSFIRQLTKERKSNGEAA